jgi:Lipase (class 3)
MMKKIGLLASLTLMISFGSLPAAKAQSNLISGSTLTQNTCVEDFSRCARIAETANTLSLIYRNKNKNEQEVERIAKDSLSQDGAGWDKGYKTKDIQSVSVKKKVIGVTLVDAQAIFASKIRNEGGSPKKQYLISIRGTEQLEDWITNIRALRSEDFTDSTKVGAGFWDYANTIAETDEFKALFGQILESERLNERYEVLISGHSLGGAAAVILKAMIENSVSSSAKERISAVTFGAPPVGDQAFVDKYGKRVIGINISGDPVPGLGAKFLWQAQKAGDIYEFERPNDLLKAGEKIWERSQQFSNNLSKLNFIGALVDALPTGIIGDVASTVFGVDSHMNGYSEAQRYESARNSGWYDLRNSLMQHSLTGITQGSSSHIGSAAYYLGRSSNNDPQLTKDLMTSQGVRRVEQFSGASTVSFQQREEYTSAGSITNLRAPVDIVLNWDQSIATGQLDLDSHLTGPTSLGSDSPVRFHTNFNDKGSIGTAPYVQLYRDVIPANGGSGDEQTRIQVLQDGIYRFYVHDYTNRYKINSPALAQSGANVTVYTSGKDLPQEGQNINRNSALGGAINVPTDGRGNVWYTFQLDSRTGILKRVLVPFGNESDRSLVPRIGETLPNSTLPR